MFRSLLIFTILSLTLALDQCVISPPPMFPPFQLNTTIHHSTHCKRNSMEEILNKKYNMITLDGHDEAMYHWLNLGLLNTSDTKYTLIHIDSHADMTVIDEIHPDVFDDSPPWNKLRELGIDIGDFIMPMVYAGVIERIIWIRPTWERYSHEIEEDFMVGTVPGTNEFSVNSGDLLFATGVETALENANKVKFIRCGIDSPMLDEIKIEPKRTLLDIDIDYFSTSNPAHHILTTVFNKKREYFVKIADSYNIDKICVDYDDIPDSLKFKFKSHDPVSFDFVLKALFIKKYLHKHFPRPGKKPLTDEEFLALVAPAVKGWCDKNATEQFLLTKHFLEDSMKIELPNIGDIPGNQPELDHLLEYIAMLPWTILKKKEIEPLINSVDLYLKKIFSKEKPAYITVVKSETDFHTPGHLVDHLLMRVYAMLYNLWE